VIFASTPADDANVAKHRLTFRLVCSSVTMNCEAICLSHHFAHPSTPRVWTHGRNCCPFLQVVGHRETPTSYSVPPTLPCSRDSHLRFGVCVTVLPLSNRKQVNLSIVLCLFVVVVLCCTFVCVLFPVFPSTHGTSGSPTTANAEKGPSYRRPDLVDAR
jgi:hypothetical protein